MKTLAILFILAFGTLQSQVNILSVENKVCPGDSIHVTFTWNGELGTTDFTGLIPILGHVWNINNNQFYSLNKILVGTDTVYTIALPTHSLWPVGTMTFGILFSNIQVILLNCDYVNIQEYINSPNQSKLYFDLLGLPTALTPNKIIIELTITPSGILSRKIITSN
jgi:hypothetical protein